MKIFPSIGMALVVLSAGCAPPAPPPSVGPTLSAAPTSSAAATPTVVRSPSAPTSTPSPFATSAEEARVEGWRSDIDQLISRLQSMHPQLEEQVSIAELESAAADLSTRVPDATDDEMLVGIMGLVAMVSRKGCDAHTGAYVWGDGDYPVDSLPLRLWLFGNDVYIVDALPPYEGLVGQWIRQVAGRPTEEVLPVVDPIVPRDNDETVRLLMPRFLLIPQVLRGLGLPIGSTVTLQTQDRDGVKTDTAVQPIPMSDYNEWAGAYGLHMPADPDVLYLSRMDELLWWQKLKDGALYVQYNEMQIAALPDLETALAEPDVNVAVLDLRHNFGGEVFTVDRMKNVFADWLAADPKRHLDVATGRNTFSAASLLVARLAELDRVDIVGEPMGGCPTGWGNNRDFPLGYSKIPISVSTTFEIGASPDDKRPTIQPDVVQELTHREWFEKIDPVVESHVPGPA